MPQLILAKMGDVKPVICCCGKETFPVLIEEGDRKIKCNYEQSFFGGNRTMYVRIRMGSKGQPIVDTGWD